MAAVSACQLLLPFQEASGENDGGTASDAPIDVSGADADAASAPDADAAIQADATSDAVAVPDADACAPGTCQPIPLASGQSNPVALRLYAGEVYWTTYDGTARAGVWKVSVAGGGMPQMLVADPWLSGLTVGPNGVYWSDTAGVATYADGGVETYVANTHVQALTEDDASVYWSDWGTNKPIYSQPFGTPASNPPATPLYTNAGTAFGLTYYQGDLYWTVNDTNIADGLVMFGPVTGGSPTTIMQSQANPWGISVDATGVYWANSGTNDGPPGTPEQAVWVQPMGGGAARAIATGLSHPLSVWADPNGPYVYWVEMGSPASAGLADGRVARANKTGAPNVTVLATGQALPGDIVGDDTSIYWVNGGIPDDAGVSTTGQIMKLPK